MALKAVLAADAFAALPDLIKAEYSPAATEGFHALQVESVATADGKNWALEDVAGLKSGISKVRKERDDALTRSARLDLFGDLDPEKAKKDAAMVAEMANWTQPEKAKAQLDATIAQVTEKHQKDFKVVLDENAVMKRDLHETLIDSAAILAIGAKGNAALLLPHIQKRASVVIDPITKKRVARILNPDGSERISLKSGSQAPMTIEEFVDTDLKELYPEAYVGTKARGGGNDGGGGGGGGGGPHTISEQDARDPVKYRAAKAAAEKAGHQLRMV